MEVEFYLLQHLVIAMMKLEKKFIEILKKYHLKQNNIEKILEKCNIL